MTADTTPLYAKALAIQLGLVIIVLKSIIFGYSITKDVEISAMMSYSLHQEILHEASKIIGSGHLEMPPKT